MKIHYDLNGKLPDWSKLSGGKFFEFNDLVNHEAHYHDYDEYWIIYQGKARIDINSRESTVGSGDILLIRRGFVHHVIELVEKPLKGFWFGTELEGLKRSGHVAPNTIASSTSKINSVQRNYLENEVLPTLNATGRVLWVGIRDYCDYKNLLPNCEYITMDIDPSVSSDIIGDITRCPEIESDSFDWILFNGVFEMLENPREAIDEIHRLLKVNGKLMIGAPFLSKGMSRLDKGIACQDYWRITENGMRMLLKKFTIERLENVHDVYLYAIAEKK